MDRPLGRITELARDAAPPTAEVEIISAIRCPRCAAGKGCGAGLLDGDGRVRRVTALLPPELDARRGDRVWLDLQPKALLRGSVLAYGAPLAGILLLAAGAHLVGLNDAQAVAATLAGGIAGAVAGRMSLRRAGCVRRLTPSVVGRQAGEAD